MSRGGRTVVLGVGNRWRRDDGVGPAVADAVKRAGTGGVDVIEVDGEAARVVDAWAGAELAVVVDAVRTGAAPGTVQQLDAGALAPTRPTSSHALGVVEAMALGQAVGRLPRRLVIVAVEGAEFGQGPGLTPQVAAAIDAAARLVITTIEDAH